MRVLLLLCSFLLAGSVSGKELEINFADFTEGTSPTNFHAELAGEGNAPQWKIVSAEVPSMIAPTSARAMPNHRSVLAQTSADMTDEHFPMFIYDGDTFNDFRMSVRFEIVSGIAEQMAGLVFRFQNTSNFYVARISTLGQNIRFYKVVNGDRSNPIGPTLNVPAGTWHSLGVNCDGNRINIYLDGQAVIPTLNDTSFGAGKIGFWTKSDSLTYFADLSIDYTPRVPPAQAMVDSVMSDETRLLGLRIYTLQTENGTNAVRVIASKVPGEVGMNGTAAELDAINTGKTYIGRLRDSVFVTSPLHDRNGDYMGAMRVEMKTFFGETDDTASTRANLIRKKLEDMCGSSDELLGK